MNNESGLPAQRGGDDGESSGRSVVWRFGSRVEGEDLRQRRSREMLS